ncbi:MAG: ArnT family glycosyltransferase [Pseudonocardiaceae bacterium]
MTTTATTDPEMSVGERPRSWSGVWSVGAVVLGSGLILWAAVNQPYNQNELVQIAPYGSNSIAEIVGATRQPPLGPLLGAMFQHLLGEGHLRQRLVPVGSGIGTLVVTALLMRRLGLGAAGAFGLWVLATAPLMVRFSAYTRPYALPLFLMVLFLFAAQRWIDTRRRAWLLMAALAAVALPLARVPEPTAFLLMAAGVLLVLGVARRLTWAQTLPLVVISLGALVLVGYAMFRALASDASGYFDLSPSGVISRLGPGAGELTTGFLPLLADWLPWWPITVLVVVLAVALPGPRRVLTRWWFVWPLSAAPVAFALAYHFLGTVSFEVLPYRPRAAYFFVVPYVWVVVALATLVTRASAGSRGMRIGVAALLCGALLGQLPATASVVLRNGAPDFDQAGDVVAGSVPEAAVVLYDRPEPAPQSRMSFLAKPRFLPAQPPVLEVSKVARHPRRLPPGAPVYLLVNGQCAQPGLCTPFSAGEFREPVPGWRVVEQFDRFTLYEPVNGQSGRVGAIEGLRALGSILGPELGYTETFAAASLLELRGRTAEGRQAVRQMYAAAPPGVRERIEMVAGSYAWTDVDRRPGTD